MSKRLFVGNLSFNTTNSDLETAFAPFEGTGAAVITDHDGQSKGFGFVDVPENQLNAAISTMNGKELHSRALTVNEARPRTESGGGGGNRGGGSRGGGGGYGGGGGNRW